MIDDAVIPLSEHFRRLQAQGSPDFLTRELERRTRELPALDGLFPDFLEHLARALPEHLRSPLVRTPERASAVEKAVREWLEKVERTRPEVGLSSTPQVVRKLSALAGLGPLEALLADPEVTEIIVENHRSVLVEKNGRTVPVAGLSFPSEEEWRRQALALCALSGRPIGVDHPMQTFTLSDGSRVVVAVPPAAARGTVMNIRRKRTGTFTLEALVERGALSRELASYLEDLVRAWANVLVCGESGCGKTSLLEALVNAMSPRDRAVVVEENAELNPVHPHLRYLLASPDASEKGISLRDCARFSMLMSPRRLIVGEAKEGEAADMLFAITSGFSGCMTTIHAYSGADALDRLYIAALMDPGRRYGEGGEVLRRAITAAVDVIVHLAFSPQGKRHVDAVHEVWGMDGRGRWDVRPAWEAFYGGEESEEIFWQRPEGYEPSPRLREKLRAYRGRTAAESRELPETPIERAARHRRLYLEAVTLGSNGLYEKALERLRALSQENPGYLDVERLIAEYEGRIREQERKMDARVERLLDFAREAVRRGDRAGLDWALAEIAELRPEAAERLRAELEAAG